MLLSAPLLRVIIQFRASFEKIGSGQGWTWIFRYWFVCYRRLLSNVYLGSRWFEGQMSAYLFFAQYLACVWWVVAEVNGVKALVFGVFEPMTTILPSSWTDDYQEAQQVLIDVGRIVKANDTSFFDACGRTKFSKIIPSHAPFVTSAIISPRSPRGGSVNTPETLRS